MSSLQPQGMERRVVPFAIPAGSRIRARADAGDHLGVILLFTGVQYERPAAVPAPERCPPREPHVRN